MGLDFGLFTRRDVRDTANIAGTPKIGDFTSAQHTHLDVAGGGLTGDVRSIAVGEGLDTTAATGAITLSAEDSTAGNKGVIIVSPGEGMNVNYASGTATVSAEDSSAGNKGIVIVAGGEGMDVSYASGTATVAGEDASTTNKGVAQFNSDDFAASSGTISLKNKTSYWSCDGSNFHAEFPDVDDVKYFDENGGFEASADDIRAFAPVFLPHGAVVTSVLVNGTGGNTWRLFRHQTGFDGSVMATQVVGATDSTITDATIDNSTYSYFFQVDDCDTGDDIVNAIISYTTDYD